MLVIGILGNGFFGAGIRAVQEREQNILRRFKVTPISPTPILFASMVTGWALVSSQAGGMTLICAHARALVLRHARSRTFAWSLVIVSLGVFAFRSIGLIFRLGRERHAQESTVLIQLLYMPMLFLSGATLPIMYLPGWAQFASRFLPATYLVTGLQSVLLRKESLARNGGVIAALMITTVMAMFISVQIFRWEKEEKLRPAAKLWVLAARLLRPARLLPRLIMK